MNIQTTFILTLINQFTKINEKWKMDQSDINMKTNKKNNLIISINMCRFVLYL